MMPPRTPRGSFQERLTVLVYELLDAHHDTVALTTSQLDEDRRGHLEALRWRAHLDYLRALQRTARELLAELWATSPTHAGDRWDGST